MFVLFFLLWVIFNGQWTLEIAIFGVVIAAVMYAFVCKFMDYSVKKDLFILRGNGGNRISYLFGKRFVGQTVFCVHKITSGSADVGDRMLLILISFRERYHKKSAVSTLFRENTAVCGVKIL